jgi:hypothetical protein
MSAQVKQPAEHPATLWARGRAFEPIHIDCITAVMLKILDGKCKMSEADKAVVSVLYDAVKSRPGKLLGDPIHTLIAEARHDLNETMCMRIYEQRLYAETMISRPVMKAFKAMLREEGITGSHSMPA